MRVANTSWFLVTLLAAAVNLGSTADPATAEASEICRWSNDTPVTSQCAGGGMVTEEMNWKSCPCKFSATLEYRHSGCTIWIVMNVGDCGAQNLQAFGTDLVELSTPSTIACNCSDWVNIDVGDFCCPGQEEYSWDRSCSESCPE